jgi:hypothetical protein
MTDGRWSIIESDISVSLCHSKTANLGKYRHELARREIQDEDSSAGESKWHR